MKKLSIFAVLITFIAIPFMSCLSTSVSEESQSIGMIENASPENSVLVYGFSSEPDIKIYYVDEKNNWETLISTGDGYFSLPPAYKGGKLVVKGSSWQKSSSATTFQGNMQIDTHYVSLHEITNDEWTVNVPKDKPLYFMGIHSIQAKNIMDWESIQALKAKSGTVVLGMPKTEEEYKALIDKYEIKCLNKLLKKYKGTAWETVISEKLAELKN